MVHNIFKTVFCSVFLIAGTSISTVAADFDGTCTILYKGDEVISSECTATQDGDIVTIKGVDFEARIDNEEDEGILKAITDSGKLVLAEGELKSNSSTRIRFQNSYELDMEMTTEEAVEGAAETLIEQLFKK